LVLLTVHAWLDNLFQAGRFPGTDCRMNGFDKEQVQCGHGRFPACPITHPQYAYVPAAETKLYFEMEERYVLADEMFASNFDQSSFVAHQYLIAAQSDSAVNFPSSKQWGCEGGSPQRLASDITPRIRPTVRFGARIRQSSKSTTVLIGKRISSLPKRSAPDALRFSELAPAKVPLKRKIVGAIRRKRGSAYRMA
jgi:hypothetical protein